MTDSSEEVIDAAFTEARRRDPEHRRTWVVVVDGSPTQLRLVRQAAKKCDVEVEIVIFIHVLEYLWGAAHCFPAEIYDPAILGPTAPAHVARGYASEPRRGRHHPQCNAAIYRAPRAIEKCAAYLCNLAPHIHYAHAIANGLPIASGVVEGMCSYLVNHRMDKTGSRWSLQGAEAVLHLRVLRANDDFAELLQFHSQAEHTRRHASRYEGPVPYPLTPKPTIALRRVKRVSRECRSQIRKAGRRPALRLLLVAVRTLRLAFPAISIPVPCSTFFVDTTTP